MTRLELINTAEEPYRSQMIENTDLMLECKSNGIKISDILDGLFTWHYSPQGHTYWRDYCMALKEKGL